MMRLVAVAVACAVSLGCGRSADDGAGFDQAVQDMKNGVKPSQGAPNEEYRQGYREAADAIEQGIRRKDAHAADQQRAQEIHERVLRK